MCLARAVWEETGVLVEREGTAEIMELERMAEDEESVQRMKKVWEEGEENQAKKCRMGQQDAGL